MKNKNFNPFPKLVSQRLVLRKLLPTDDTAIFRLRSSVSVNKFTGRPLATVLIEAQEFIQARNEGIDKNEFLYWGIADKNSDALIGTICLWNFSDDDNQAELGYELHPDFQGKGFMNEALQQVIDFGFGKLNLNSIVAITAALNTSSINLLLKNNFSLKKELSSEEKTKEEKDKKLELYELIKNG